MFGLVEKMTMANLGWVRLRAQYTHQQKSNHFRALRMPASFKIPDSESNLQETFEFTFVFRLQDYFCTNNYNLTRYNYFCLEPSLFYLITSFVLIETVLQIFLRFYFMVNTVRAGSDCNCNVW